MTLAFVVAPAGERTLGAGAYLFGAVELLAVIAALGFGAHRVRLALLPGWSGAPARLVEVVLGVAGLIWVSEALGTFGGFEEGAVLAGMILVGVASGVVAGRYVPGPVTAASAPPAPPSWSLAKLVAVLA